MCSFKLLEKAIWSQFFFQAVIFHITDIFSPTSSIIHFDYKDVFQGKRSGGLSIKSNKMHIRTNKPQNSAYITLEVYINLSVYQG